MENSGSLRNNTKGFLEVADAVKAAIATGQLKPGQRLVEAQLCQLFGVKRSRVREALHKLEHDGFVRIISNVGAIVAEFSRSDVEYIYDLLSVVDGLAVRLATPFVTSEQWESLEALVERMKATDNLALFSQCNDDLHTRFCIYSENGRLISFEENLRLSIKAFGYRSFYARGQVEASNAEHRQILQAMKENKPLRAERIMRSHIGHAKNRLLKWIYRSP
jgi:DNA-binding GntR family transcriptional regulator